MINRTGERLVQLSSFLAAEGETCHDEKYKDAALYSLQSQHHLQHTLASSFALSTLAYTLHDFRHSSHCHYRVNL